MRTFVGFGVPAFITIVTLVAACSAATDAVDQRSAGGDDPVEKIEANAEAETRPTTPAVDQDDEGDGQALPPEPPIATKLARQPVVLRTFEQYNNTLSQLTGLPTKTVAAKFSSIRNQLPASSDYASASAFNQIAATNLAFDYCDKYIDRETALHALEPAAFVDSLILAFLDREAKDALNVGETRSVLLTLATTSDLVPGGNRVRLQKLTCAAFLSSSWFTIY